MHDVSAFTYVYVSRTLEKVGGCVNRSHRRNSGYGFLGRRTVGLLLENLEVGGCC